MRCDHDKIGADLASSGQDALRDVRGECKPDVDLMLDAGQVVVGQLLEPPVGRQISLGFKALNDFRRGRDDRGHMQKMHPRVHLRRKLLRMAEADERTFVKVQRAQDSLVRVLHGEIARGLLAAPPVEVVFKLAPRSPESLLDRRRKIVPGFMVDAHVATRKREVDPHVERAAPMVMADSAIHDDVTAVDAVVAALEFCDFRSNLGFGRLV